MKRFLLAVLLLAPTVSSRAQSRDSLLVVFWNVENFFDWTADGTSDSENEFSAAGSRRWTKKRFFAKCSGISKVLMLIAGDFGRVPDIVCFAEIENRRVLSLLLSSSCLRKLDYSIVHYDSHDPRGIDCGLIYRKSSLELLRSSPKHLYDSSGALIPTRDILLAEFGNMCVLVNHHPSKLGGKGERRQVAMSRMNAICDSLGKRSILCVGDFNDDVWKSGGKGTIKYNGAWEKIDGTFSRNIKEVDETVYDNPILSVQDSRFGGLKPRRTYVGPRYAGGISDHYPIVAVLRF